MNVARSVAEVLDEHTTLELECIDRLYLNVYVPLLQSPAGVAYFFRHVRGHPVASSALMAPMTRRFVEGWERYARREGVDLIRFERGERKDERTQGYLRDWHGGEGVLYIGKAQERARVVRTERRHDPITGAPYPWLVASTAMVNHYYVYLVDDDFGALFVKFCSYFPYNAKLCVNGHEYVKRQLAKRAIGFEALDNGIMRCDDPDAMQAIAEEVTAPRIDALLRKWLARLPHPFTGADRMAHIRYELSILQAEFALTQVFDRPVQGRVLFEEVMRENLDLGRPDQVQLIFNRRSSARPPVRTRHHRRGHPGCTWTTSTRASSSTTRRALRTETVVNNTYDFAIGRRLCNLDDLKQVGFNANRRLLRVQRLSHDCPLGVQTFEQLHRPAVVDERRVSALRFGDPRIQALLGALLVFRLLPMGFANRELRAHVAPLLGVSADAYGSTRATYDLRRLRLRGLVERIPRSHRYRVTEAGQRVALCYSRGQRRVLGPTLSAVFDDATPPALGRLVKRFDDHINRLWQGQPLAA